MFVPVSEKDRLAYFNQNNTCFIPGYTGHCPTLRFHYGTCYGTKTKEILRELRDTDVLRQIARDPYRPDDMSKAILKPIPRPKEPMRDYSLNTKYRAPRYVIGYTGFVPTLNFRYGKSYSRTADESRNEFDGRMHNRHVNGDPPEHDMVPPSLYRSISAAAKTTSGKVAPIRNHDEMEYALRHYDEQPIPKSRNVSSSFPPIAGYTGHIPRAKDVLSQRYRNVVIKSLAELEAARQRKLQMSTAEEDVQSIVDNIRDHNQAQRHL